ncbi:MAG: sulfurtransferase, partial [Cyanothece sp. SIO1E1]|nr:sulfurtransferase [Cyanothece sp. SIO1E1]
MTQYLVSPQWLYQHLEDADVVVIDCRFALTEPNLGPQAYQLGHIPEAHYLHLNHDLSGPVAKHGGRHPLPDPNQFAERLAALGIHSENTGKSTFVVTYDDSRFAFAARLWWLLRYLGHEHVAVLDGGFKHWQQLGYPTTTASPQRQPGIFIPELRSHQLVDINAVKARKDNPGVALVDSREGSRYRGEHEPIDPIADDSEQMPPADAGERLTAQEIATLKQWIDQGADWPTESEEPKHWAYVPPVKQPLP